MFHVTTSSKITKDKRINVISKPSISLYLEPPQHELTLDEFEVLSLKRLELLRSIDIFKAKGYDDKTKSNKVFELERKLMLVKAENKSSNFSDDEISHFILRLAYCRSEELRRWFLQQECTLLKIRLENMRDDDEKSRFMSENGMDFEPVPDEEKMEKAEFLCGLSGISNNNLTTSQFYKIPFIQALSLVQQRSIYLERGIAFVPLQKLFSIIVARFRISLSKALTDASNMFEVISSDSRIGPLLKNMSKQFIGDDFSGQNASVDKLTPERMDYAADQHMPLCMKNLHLNLKREHKLKHWGRLQYGLFLKGAGLDLEGAQQFWESQFTKIMNHDQFVKGYSYSFRHMYGKEGARKNYTPYSCMKIIMGPPPESGAHHGCPFKHMSDGQLTSLLATMKIHGEDAKDITTTAKTGNYQVACQKHFELLHPPMLGTAASLEDKIEQSIVANHPNMWFQSSVRYHKAKSGKADPVLLKTEATPNPTETMMDQSKDGHDLMAS